MELMKYYYYPLCSKDYAFENIFASESISPPGFYSERGFGIGYFYTIPKYNHQDALILYNRPPKYETGTEQESIKFILEIAESAFDFDGIIVLNEGIICYPKTVYLRKDNFNVLFFSEKDQKVSMLKSETSLPTKGLKKYDHNFKIISESDCTSFDTAAISSLKLEQEGIKKEIEFDRRYNYFKGFVYGLGTGLVSVKSPDESKVNQILREISNSFAELKNRFEIKVRETGNRYVRPSAVPESQTSNYEKNLNRLIKEGDELFKELFPGKLFTEEKMAVYLSERFKERLPSIESSRRFIDYMIIEDELFGTNHYQKLRSEFFKSKGEISPAYYFGILKEQARIYVENAKTNTSWSKLKKEETNGAFKDAMFELDQFVEREFLKKTQLSNLDLEPIHFDLHKNMIGIKPEFRFINIKDLTDFVSTINCILRNPKRGTGETQKEQILLLVEEVGTALHENINARKTKLYQYLAGQINAYSIEKVNSKVMKNFVAFIFNLDSFEKLENFVQTKEIEERWIAYCCWCSFNGFAKTSRNFLKPVFDTDNVRLQDSIDSYLGKFLSYKAISEFIETTTIASESFRTIEVEKDYAKELAQRNRQFFEQYDFGKFIINFTEFDQLIRNGGKDQIIIELKEKYKISKKAGEKILRAYTEFMNSSALF